MADPSTSAPQARGSPVSAPSPGGPAAADGDRIHLGHRVRPFRPAPWLPGAHLQTVVGKFLRPRPGPDLVRERIPTPDGDFLDLDFTPDPEPHQPLVVVLHGLEGSSERAYVRLALVELSRHGLAGVALNFRSCSGEPNRRPRFYHSGETRDVGLVVRFLHERFPRRRLGALGFSLGGNVLLKYLGEPAEAGEAEPQDGRAGGHLLSAAAAISVPFDLAEGSRAIEIGAMGRVYTHYFLRSLRAKIARKRGLLEPLLDLAKVMEARTLREYDEVATAPLHGFPGADAYYEASSSARFLERIRTPTLLMQAGDDPFLPESALPREVAAKNPFLLPAFVPRGGHVGFVEGALPWQASFWAEREAARYLARLLGGRSGSRLDAEAGGSKR